MSSTKLDPKSELRRVREAEACRDRILERISESKEGVFIIVSDFNDHPGSSSFHRFKSKVNTNISEFCTRVTVVENYGLIFTKKRLIILQ